jgi:DnaJ-class molecular chaperone
MDTQNNTADFLEILFSGEAAAGPSVAEVAAAEVAEMKADKAARDAVKAANRCPKCAGAGYLPQFAHRKAGECFACGGSGVFTRYH